ncbi:Wadjet anti-phage system protein JetD domain-containing protein [Proteiniclasticum sp.]|uniref:Wadjet anti-phage system protein JetD domain-containing protein n=1 Tax=Proteiniclasticum sp. TaxID=2053595 RepID=UPI00289E817F|nr:Wadjet anti-phage system protein JetD domain-containing protein [Proteiniclasticum sp.]
MNLKLYIEKHTKKTVELNDLLSNYPESYEAAASDISLLVGEGALIPVKASGMNGRRPLLYNRYKIVSQEKDYTQVFTKVKLLHARFDHQYYLTHPEQYLVNAEDIEALSDFLWKRSHELKAPMSINERSFSIFGKEKLLKFIEHQFSTYFRMKEFTLEDLHTYPTPEPFFEYIHPELEKGEILIIENKDTWYTLRKIMREEDKPVLFGIPFKVLLYGEGKKITRQSGRLREYIEEILGEEKADFYYFGDLDYEGISIYQEAKMKNPEVHIKLLVDAYEAMLEVHPMTEYPTTRDYRAPRADLVSFLSHFKTDHQEKIVRILEKGQYIPQEILNHQILGSRMKGQNHV